jgi:hypothetical protein
MLCFNQGEVMKLKRMGLIFGICVFAISVNAGILKIENPSTDSPVIGETKALEVDKVESIQKSDSKSREEAVPSKNTYKDKCSIHIINLMGKMSELFVASESNKKYKALVNDIEKRLKVLLKCVPSGEKDEVQLIMQKEIPILKTEQKCFQKLAFIQNNSIVVATQYQSMGEVRKFCKSWFSRPLVLNAEDRFNAEAEKTGVSGP